ncbi:hypothetical protein [Nakamurella aerolata]|uniref:Uncharacterized protein n=1 Tax=Nakamurella aerolata TaxID=1656892 RepID=A0A849A3E1_9ACTN|nr:hypothetical protein [Nakamurella aerolata]NNG34587.1 hypothetical protein [Nakamurella aerolata]
MLVAPLRGNLRAGLVAGWTSVGTSLISGGIACVLAVGRIAARTPGLSRARIPRTDGR